MSPQLSLAAESLEENVTQAVLGKLDRGEDFHILPEYWANLQELAEEHDYSISELAAIAKSVVETIMKDKASRGELFEPQDVVEELSLIIAMLDGK